jgi:hypothetical protein
MDPLYLGATVSIRQEPAPGGPLLALRPRAGHRFLAPAVDVLHLPPEGLASVSAHPIDGDFASLVFFGDLARAGHPHTITLEPVGLVDAISIGRLLSERHRLPRAPVEQGVETLRGLPAGSFVRVVGRWGVDFAGVTVEGPREVLRRLEPGARYRVTGFYGAGTLRALSIASTSSR